MNLDRLIRQLRKQAKVHADGEGWLSTALPAAQPQNHLEWLASDQIIALRKLCGNLAEALVEFSENDMYTEATATLVERGRAVDMEDGSDPRDTNVSSQAQAVHRRQTGQAGQEERSQA